jgi:hypothetical protein
MRRKFNAYLLAEKAGLYLLRADTAINLQGRRQTFESHSFYARLSTNSISLYATARTKPR